MSLCILPAAEKTRSTPADEAGAEKYCLTILAKAGHLLSFACHQESTITSISGSSGSIRYSSSSSICGALGVVGSFLRLNLATEQATQTNFTLLGVWLGRRCRSRHGRAVATRARNV